jgi:ABC-type multidrug transport system fused ATPase/permease subunit
MHCAGVAFAAQGVSQFGNFSEAFTQARVAAYGALQAINRKPGSPEEIIYRTEEEDIGSTTHSKNTGTKHSKSSGHGELVESDKIIKAILPKYEIDSTSDKGLKPEKASGHIAFKNVRFTYPTRPREEVLHGISTEINPGQTVAFVGPRYVTQAA